MANYVIAIQTASGLFAGQAETILDTNVMRVTDKIVDLTQTFSPALTVSDTLDVIALPPETLVDRGFIQVTQAATTGTTGTLALALVAPATTLVTGAANNVVGYTMSTPTTTSNGVVPAGTNSSGTIPAQVYGTATTPGGTTARLSFATALGNPILRCGVIYLDISAVTAKVN